MIELMALLAAGSAAVLGFSKTRDFVRTRLRFVEAVHKSSAPLKAGALATLVAAPAVWVIPVIGAGTALAFGISVAAGVAAGRRDIRRKLPGSY